MKTESTILLEQARTLRGAFPDMDAMRRVTISPPPGGEEVTALRAAMRHLWAEMVLMQSGGAKDVGVLDDEIANTERALAR